MKKVSLAKIKKMVKDVSMVLVLALVVSMFPMMSDPVDAKAASARPRTLQEAVNIVVGRLEDKFITANGKSSAGMTKNTEMHSILASQWLHDLFPEITNWSKANFLQASSAWGCFGGSQLILWLANELYYGGNVKLGYKKVVSCKLTKSNIVKYAKIGDHIRINNSTSVVFLGVNSDNTIKVAGVNYNPARYGNNRLTIYNRKLDSKSMVIYRAYVK